MKFARPAGFRVMPEDGLIRLGPQESLHIDARSLPDPSHDDALATVRRARATILALTFAVENELVITILADKFNTRDPQYGGPKYLKEEAWLRRLTLGAHVIATIKILRRENILTETLRIDLQGLLAARNALAHRPCWLEPLRSTPNGMATAFIGKIANDEHIWSVDDQQIEEWESLIGRCLAVRDAATEMLSKREIPNVKYELRGWPVGVRLPQGDPLGNRSPIEGVGPAGYIVHVASGK